ncbi:hypothetical protein GYMLUDRAFT_1016609 [Collybiopsis luxurians FD-317 M1]|uniref:Unplaced genomic scaffold GYMLUscaffold_52, whole genome shotgun sequence n=1 Tax=Collybiopsis luxurians FD-317 M1 TaxID=944289 RepID=A0A0D0CDF7_9AGAR|nr:hypothetical protein GYMLUDRAFT_1016609 [Collybiopsis luxurians FD-317 M1]
MTQARLDIKFAAIHVAALECYTESDPFTNIHLPGQYSLSYQLGSKRIMAPAVSSSSIASTESPSSNNSTQLATKPLVKLGKWHKRASVNPPKPQRNLFANLPNDDPFVPPPIPAWSNVSLTIECGNIQPQKRMLIVPDPGLFFGLADKACQMPMLVMWSYFYDSISTLPTSSYPNLTLCSISNI